MSEYLINGNIYFVVLLKKEFFSEFPSEHLLMAASDIL